MRRLAPAAFAVVFALLPAGCRSLGESSPAPATTISLPGAVALPPLLTVDRWDWVTRADGSRYGVVAFRATNVSGVPVYHDGDIGQFANCDVLERVGGRWRPVLEHTCVVYGKKAELEAGGTATTVVFTKLDCDALRCGCRFWSTADWTGPATVVWSDAAYPPGTPATAPASGPEAERLRAELVRLRSGDPAAYDSALGWIVEHHVRPGVKLSEVERILGVGEAGTSASYWYSPVQYGAGKGGRGVIVVVDDVNAASPTVTETHFWNPEGR